MARYSKEHREQTYKRLVSEGSRCLKAKGLEGTSVAKIGASVGLSGPALYTHFPSKDAFFRAVIDRELSVTLRRFLDTNVDLEHIIDGYINLRHARSPETGCALVALSSDVARASASAREIYTSSFLSIVEALAEFLDDQDLAPGILAAAVGAVSIARAMPDDDQATKVLVSSPRLILSALEK